MKKLIIILLFVPLFAQGQTIIDTTIGDIHYELNIVRELSILDTLMSFKFRIKAEQIIGTDTTLLANKAIINIADLNQEAALKSAFLGSAQRTAVKDYVKYIFRDMINNKKYWELR